MGPPPAAGFRFEDRLPWSTRTNAMKQRSTMVIVLNNQLNFMHCSISVISNEISFRFLTAIIFFTAAILILLFQFILINKASKKHGQPRTDQYVTPIIVALCLVIVKVFNNIKNPAWFVRNAMDKI